MFNVKGIEHLLIEDMKKAILTGKSLNLELGPENKKINFWKTGAYLISPHPVAFYCDSIARDLERELEIVLNQAGWLFAHAYTRSSSYDEWREDLFTNSPWFYITKPDASVYTLCYIPAKLVDKAFNTTLTKEEANELINTIIDYFDKNPSDFKFAYKDLFYLADNLQLIDVTLNVYNIRAYSDYDKAEIDLYNELRHDETIEKLYFEEVLPEIRKQIEVKTYA